MEANHKKILKAIVLELRHMLEGYYNGSGWHGGDLEQRLNGLGVWRDRSPLPADELAGISAADREARKVVDAYLKLRDEAGVPRCEAVAEFVRETAYTWANRLLALRCMESRDLIDEVILQKDVYGGRSLEHNRLAQRNPELCAGNDDGLFAVLDKTFAKQAEHLPLLFDPKALAVALKPGVATLKRAIALLSGNESVHGIEPATRDVFQASDTLGWSYQYYQQEEKQRVDDWLKTKKGFKCEGADIAPKTALYTEPYMVKFLVQNSLGASWAGMRPDTKLVTGWQYYVRDADRSPTQPKSVADITFLDPACGSGHFLLEAFDLFYSMYEEEGELTDPEVICRSILECNLYGVDIDERAVQISEAALWMKSAEKVSLTKGSVSFSAIPANLVATNIRLPRGVDHLKTFLDKHPDDKDLSSALEIVFNGLENADELGSLLQIEGPVETKLKDLQRAHADVARMATQTHLYRPAVSQEQLPIGVESYDDWKHRTLARLKAHFLSEATASDINDAFFGRAATRGLGLFDLLARRYDVVAANPPYMGSSNFGEDVKKYVFSRYSTGKADLYSAFILRCVQLASPGSRVAMVTQQSWMYLRSFGQLRFKASADDSPSTGLLATTTIELLMHLGSGAFREIGGEVVNSVLFVLSLASPHEQHRLTALSVTDVQDPDNKAAILRRAANSSVPERVFQPVQIVLLTIPDAPVVYQLSDDFGRLLSSGADLGFVADVKPGPQTSDNIRFNRLFWEVPGVGSRWFPLSKGGGFKRWKGLNHLVIDWQCDGLRIKEFNQRNGDHWSRNVRNVSYVFKEGITYSAFSSTFSARVLTKQEVCDTKGPGIYCEDSLRLPLLGYLNTRVTQYILKLLSPALDFNPRNVAKLPVPQELPSDDVVRSIIQLKGLLTASEMSEYSFCGSLMNASLRNSISALVGLAEDYIEKACVESLALSPAARNIVREYAGFPAGSLPMVVGFDELPTVDGWHPPSELRDEFTRLKRVQMTEGQLNDLKRDVRNAYLSSDRSSLSPSDSDPDEDQVSESEESVPSLRSAIPRESTIEELAYLFDIHPISVYWLLQRAENIDVWKEPLAREYCEGRASMLLLRILGHRWPAEHSVVTPEPISNGVLPISDYWSESFGDMIDRLADENFQTAFTEVVEESLLDWFSRHFFEHHSTQFRKRPVAWHLSSASRSARRKPALQLIVYYGRLSTHTLAFIQSQFLRPQRQRHETEMRSIESVSQSARSDRQQERLTELMDLINELRTFDEQLEAISRSGFSPEKFRAQLRQYAIDDALLCLKAQWLHKLSDTIFVAPLAAWRDKANGTKLHASLARWIEDSISRLGRHCSAVGPSAPKAETLQDDPTSPLLACLICKKPDEMVQSALKLACIDWWTPLAEAVLTPIRVQIKTAKDELRALKEEDYSKAENPFKRRKEIDALAKELKENVKRWERDLNEKIAAADKLREEINAWKCPEARTWEDWLAAQPMYDAISGLDGVHQPPQTLAEWVAQESAYAPDINDGVRVNIAPLQKAGILAADILAAKDVDKAIADRAEWRADERRWCREGKLPQPGWWSMEKTNASGQD